MELRFDIVLSVIVGVAIVIMGAIYFQGFVSARVVAPSSQPIRLFLDEQLLIGFETTTHVPAVRIELCRDDTVPTEKCILLAREATGSEAELFLPPSYPVGKAILRVMNYRDVDQLIVGDTQYRQAVVVASR